LSVREPDLTSPGERVTIPDGTSILIRPIQPADKRAIEIGFDGQAFGRDVDRQLVMLADNQGPRHIDCAIDRLPHLNARAGQLDLPARQSREIEQVVHKAGHVRDLPLEHFAFATKHRRIAQLHQLQGRQRRSERVSQLVTEDSQELIFCAVGFLGVRSRRVGKPELLVTFDSTPLQ